MKERAKTEQVEVGENAQVRHAREAAGTTAILFVSGTSKIPYTPSHAVRTNFSMY